MVRYYGYYSNKSRGMRAKAALANSPAGAVMRIDSGETPRRIPSKKWRELIKKVWEVDPLECPHCGGEMKIIALIDDGKVIEKILKHLGLLAVNPEPWIGYESARGPPERADGYSYEPHLEDPMPDYESEDQTSAVA